MKRDMDLVREILLTIEASEEFHFKDDKDANLPRKFRDRYTGKQVVYHLVLLEEAGLINYLKTNEMAQVALEEWEEIEEINRLTWEGHEFLDLARDQGRWNQARKVIIERGGSLTFDILKAVLTQLTRQAVGL